MVTIFDILSGNRNGFQFQNAGGTIIIGGNLNNDDGSSDVTPDEENYENVFITIDNSHSSCTDEDLYYINISNISNINCYKDIDTFYKMDVTFSDGRTIEFEYIDKNKMNIDYTKLLRWFKGDAFDSSYSENSDSE